MNANATCRMALGQTAGWRTIEMQNGLIRLIVLPDKGADLYQLVHVPTQVTVLYQSPWGLQPPGAPPRDGSADIEFQWNYGGGWQELFPSAHFACQYQGRAIPFHGEVATLPWAYAVEEESPAEVSVRFTVRCRQTPFELTRRMRLQRDQPTVFMEETVRNLSDAPAHFVWGHHCVVGEPFLEAGCRLHTPARVLHTAPQMGEETASLEAGQTGRWPLARRRDGGLADLRHIPGPEAHTHDGAFLTDLDGGWAAVTNPRLNLTLSLHWDPTIFKWLVVWMPYGGCEAMPLQGIYALGIEPWTARYNLERSLANNTALELAGHASLSTGLQATIQEGDWRGS